MMTTVEPLLDQDEAGGEGGGQQLLLPIQWHAERPLIASLAPSFICFSAASRKRL